MPVSTSSSATPSRLPRGIDQAGDAVQRAAVAGAEERRPHRFAAAAQRQQHFEQAQQDKFFAGDDHIGADRDRSGSALNRSYG